MNYGELLFEWIDICFRKDAKIVVYQTGSVSLGTFASSKTRIVNKASSFDNLDSFLSPLTEYLMSGTVCR